MTQQMQAITAHNTNFMSQYIDSQAIIFTKKIAEMARSIPELLRLVRVSKGISQEWIAEKIGLSLTSYGRYERGQTEITFSSVIKLAKIYGLSLDEFFHFGEPKYLVQEPQGDYQKVRSENEELRKQLDLANEVNESNRRLLKVFRNAATDESASVVPKSKK